MSIRFGLRTRCDMVVVPAVAAGLAGWAVDVEGFVAMPASVGSGWR
jgi:methenyltetrahydromethanopterin cyclohydrolase